jgi:dTDP-4-dehydrorhamnose 3,5-epimerase
MEFERTEIEGVWFTHSQVYGDNRGSFRECFQFVESKENTGLDFSVAQTNSSISHKGVIRGVHFSLSPRKQWKWITCLNGSIHDVVTDVRVGSATFLKSISLELSSSNGKGILIQSTLGHSFQSLEDNSLVVYCLSSSYEPNLEYGINPHDDKLAINWPLQNPILSSKDLSAPTIDVLDVGGLLPNCNIE